MSLAEDLKKEVKKIFMDRWTSRDGLVVPESQDIKLGNDAVKLDGTVLYADLSASTILVEKYNPTFAAEIYKTYLFCAAKIIQSEGGTITAYDGDRIMAVFIGDKKNTCAAKTGLKINWIVKNIINPAMNAKYPQPGYDVNQTVGIDTSSLWIARTGIRGSNDLVWVGRAANYAAKLASLSPDYPTWITKEVYDVLNDSAKFSEGNCMWEKREWSAMHNLPIYRSSWWWKVD
jgi:class 3 adenylate cyclase